VRGLTRKDGGGLEYEHSVVFRPDAALLSYLVVYKLNSPLPASKD
jgi:hypothetical protein